MGQGNNLIHIDVVFLTYNSKRNVDKPSIKLDSTCIVGLNDLIKHKALKDSEKYIMGVDAYNHFKWYNLMLRNELNKFRQNAKLKIIHWQIESANSEAFKMDHVIYKAVSIIIGQDMEHYYCANIGKNSKNINGSRLRIKTPINNIVAVPKTVSVTNLCENEECLTNGNSVNASYKKCTIDYCANNCVHCKKYIPPFINERRKTKCACYIEKNFKMIIEESEEDIQNEEEYNSNDNTMINNIEKIKTNNSSVAIIRIE